MHNTFTHLCFFCVFFGMPPRVKKPAVASVAVAAVAVASVDVASVASASATIEPVVAIESVESVASAAIEPVVAIASIESVASAAIEPNITLTVANTKKRTRKPKAPVAAVQRSV